MVPEPHVVNDNNLDNDLDEDGYLALITTEYSEPAVIGTTDIEVQVNLIFTCMGFPLQTLHHLVYGLVFVHKLDISSCPKNKVFTRIKASTSVLYNNSTWFLFWPVYKFWTVWTQTKRRKLFCLHNTKPQFKIENSFQSCLQHVVPGDPLWNPISLLPTESCIYSFLFPGLKERFAWFQTLVNLNKMLTKNSQKEFQFLFCLFVEACLFFQGYVNQKVPQPGQTYQNRQQGPSAEGTTRVWNE